MPATNSKCLYCERDSQEVPLVKLQYQGEEYWICPQHLPILIHKPSQLADILQGAEQFEPGSHPEPDQD
jgi:hypothetical protein